MSFFPRREAAAALVVCLLAPFTAKNVDRPYQTALVQSPAPAIQAVTPAATVQPEPPSISLTGLVDAHATPKTSGRTEDCLARAVYFESRGEPLEGQLAVAEVIINRVESPRFRDHICDVIRQPRQFSFVEKGVIPQPDRNSRAWEKAVAISKIALRDLWKTRASNALYFHAAYVQPSWSHRLRRTVRLGRHIFYSA